MCPYTYLYTFPLVGEGCRGTPLPPYEKVTDYSKKFSLVIKKNIANCFSFAISNANATRQLNFELHGNIMINNFLQNL